jgi:ABC-type dipeptide/oligopeptide/nickel transport system permease subunit
VASHDLVAGELTDAATMLPESAGLGRGSRAALIAFGLLFLIVLIGPALAPHSPTVPAGPQLQSPSLSFPMGTDQVGRDIFSRCLYGLRSTWWSAAAVIASGVLIGSLVGVVAGMSAGWLDGLLMRITDVFLALPAPILSIAVVSALGPSLRHTLIALAIVWWPLYARIVRGEVRALVARPFYDSARLSGLGRFRRAVRHLLPGAVPPVIVAASLDVGLLVLTLAGLSFLGLGAPQPAPELGSMVAQGLPYLLDQWWVPVMPAFVVFILAFVSNFAGDAFRDLVRER